jgi:hypothetical protein
VEVGLLKEKGRRLNGLRNLRLQNNSQPALVVDKIADDTSSRTSLDLEQLGPP